MNRLLASHLSIANVNARDREKAQIQQQGLEHRIRQVFEEFGQSVYQKHSDSAGPAEILQNIVNARAQISKLQNQIQQKTVSEGRLLTPKRLVYGGIAAALLISLMVFGYFNR